MMILVKTDRKVVLLITVIFNNKQLQEKINSDLKSSLPLRKIKGITQ